MTKKMVPANIQIDYDLDGQTIPQAIAFLTELEKKHPNGIISIEGEYDSTYLALCYRREESDAEYDKRIKAEEKQKRIREKNKASVEKRELALLEKLKRKYEP